MRCVLRSHRIPKVTKTMLGIPSSRPEPTGEAKRPFSRYGCLLVLAVVIASGCSTVDTQILRTQSHELATHPMMNPPDPTSGGPDSGRYLPEHTPPSTTPPSELAKVSLPRYRLGPPDVLLIQAVRLVPKSPYFIQSNDYLQIIVSNALPLNHSAIAGVGNDCAPQSPRIVPYSRESHSRGSRLDLDSLQEFSEDVPST